jgi:hypothetical protein
MSLFKLVLLLLPMTGPYFNAPLAAELTVRIACALLSVPCAYAWEDLAEMNRTRGHRPRSVRIAEPDLPADPPPPPASNIARPRPRRNEPPKSQTPWS